MNKQSIDAILERRQQQYQQIFGYILNGYNELMLKYIPELLKQQLSIQTYINLIEKKSNDKFKTLKDDYLNKYNEVIALSNKIATNVTQFQNLVNNALKSDLQMQLSNYGQNNLFINIMNKQQYEIYVSNRTEISRLLQELANEKTRANNVTKQYQYLQNLHATIVGQNSTEQSRLQESITHQRAHLTNEIQKHKSQIVELQHIIQKQTDEIQKLNRQSDNQQQSISNLQHNNEILKHENQVINDDYIKLKNLNRKDNIESSEKHSEQLSQLTVEIQNLKVQVLDLQNKTKRQQIEYSELENTNTRLNDKIKKLNHHIDQMKIQHLQDIENVKKELQQEQQMLQLREGTKEHLLQQLKQLQEESSELLLKNSNLKTEHKNNKLILDDFIARNKQLTVENEKLMHQNKNLLETLTLQRNGVQKAEFINRIQSLELDNSSLKQQLQRSSNSEKHERKRRSEYEKKYKELRQKYAELSVQQEKSMTTQECSQLSSQTSSRMQSSRSQSTRSQKKRARSPWIAQVQKRPKSTENNLQLTVSTQNADVSQINDNRQSVSSGRAQSSSRTNRPQTGSRKSARSGDDGIQDRKQNNLSGYQQLNINQLKQSEADIPITGDFFNIHNRNRLIFSSNQYRTKNSQLKESQNHEFRKQSAQSCSVRILNDVIVK